MKNAEIRTSILALSILSVLAAPAFAGGFSRGDADTGILYEDGNFDLSGGGVYVMPQRKYKTVYGTTVNDGAFTNAYFIPSISGKAEISKNFSCALTYTQPFGADSTYGSQTIAADRAGQIPLVTGTFASATLSSNFSTNEYGATCGANMEVGAKGRFWIVGGLFIQDFTYDEYTQGGHLHLSDPSEVGYRIGAAYEIPDYRLRAEVLYRSAVSESATGWSNPTGAPLMFSTVGAGTFPQSLQINLQSGVAPGWLVFGSVKWTNWSVLSSLDYNTRVTAGAPGVPFTSFKHKYFNFSDGWTLTGGVAHAFTDDIAGLVSLTWDKGVGSNAFISTDTWTLSAGTRINVGPGQLKLGGGISYLAAGSSTGIVLTPPSSPGVSGITATVGDDFAYSLGASYTAKF